MALRSGDGLDVTGLPRCYACNAARTRIEYDDSTYRVFRCSKCGLRFSDPTLIGEGSPWWDGLYGDDGRRRIEIGKQRSRAPITANEIIRLSRKGKIAGNRLLDVGCGYGFFLKELGGYGWEVYGCERCSDPAEFACKMGLEVYRDLQHESLWKEDSYDVITLWNVMDVLDDPIGLLSDCRKLLRRGGAILLRVPNLLPGWIRWRIASLGGKRKRYLMALPVNRYGFTVLSLESLLSRSGFVNIQVIPSPIGDLSYFLEGRSQYGKMRNQLLLRTVEYLNSFIVGLSFRRSAGFLSITMLGYEPGD